jgi:FkbM family methyltransferase
MSARAPTSASMSSSSSGGLRVLVAVLVGAVVLAISGVLYLSNQVASMGLRTRALEVAVKRTGAGAGAERRTATASTSSALDAVASTCEACVCPAAAADASAAAAGAACPPASSSSPASPPSSSPPKHGLHRFLSPPEMDTFFRVRSEIDASFGTADAEMLMPLFQVVWTSYKWKRRLANKPPGGFVDVGANVGAVSDRMIRIFSNHDTLFYRHHLDDEPKLQDEVHPDYNHEHLPFLLAVEGSPATVKLLQRRADANLWRLSRGKVVAAAAGNSSGTATYCYGSPGSEQAGLSSGAGDEKGVSAKDGEQTCAEVPVAPLADLVDKEAGKEADVFLLKIDAEGFDGLVLAGARRLFVQRRVQYVVFENHAKWSTAPNVPGYRKQRVGEVARDFFSLGYACWYVHPFGLIPFLVEGTPEGDEQYEDPCGDGEGRCSRHRIYDRGFWSNVLCALDGATDPWMRWMEDTQVPPDQDHDSLMRRP